VGGACGLVTGTPEVPNRSRGDQSAPRCWSMFRSNRVGPCSSFLQILRSKYRFGQCWSAAACDAIAEVAVASRLTPSLASRLDTTPAVIPLFAAAASAAAAVATSALTAVWAAVTAARSSAIVAGAALIEMSCANFACAVAKVASSVANWAFEAKAVAADL
jgi:hypothetical protein